MLKKKEPVTGEFRIKNIYKFSLVFILQKKTINVYLARNFGNLEQDRLYQPFLSLV